MFAADLSLCLLSHSAAGNNRFESKDFHFVFINSDSAPADFGFLSLASCCSSLPALMSCFACFDFERDLEEDLGFRKSFALLVHLYENFRFIDRINIHCFVALIFRFHLIKFSLQFFTVRFTIITLYFQFSMLE